MTRFVAALVLLSACDATCDATPAIRGERERVGHEVARDGDRRVLATTDARLWTRPADPPPDECAPGAVAECIPPFRAAAGGAQRCPCTHCRKARDGAWRWNRAECNTPLVVSFDGAPVAFTRVDAAFAVGISARTEWVSAATPWVALDRDGSGCIEGARELFAGFEALAEIDANGDGVVDARDPAFGDLVLWSDRDQDKRCTEDEIEPLAARLASLPLAHASRSDAPVTSYEGDVAVASSGARIVDVHLAPME